MVRKFVDSPSSHFSYHWPGTRKYHDRNSNIRLSCLVIKITKFNKNRGRVDVRVQMLQSLRTSIYVITNYCATYSCYSRTTYYFTFHLTRISSDPKISFAFQIIFVKHGFKVGKPRDVIQLLFLFLALRQCFAKALQQVIGQIIIMLMGCKNSNSSNSSSSRASMILVYIHKL